MKKSFVLLLLPLLLIGLSKTVFATPTQWTVADGGNDHWYEVIWDSNSTGISWTDALTLATDAAASFAPADSSNLASITSTEENQFVSTLVNSALTTASNTIGPWLGGSGTYDGTSDWGKDWAWSDNETWDAANWDTYDFNGFQPNGLGTAVLGTTYYLHYYPVDGDTGLTWNDTTEDGYTVVSYVKGYVVEYTGSPAPEPATIFLLGLGLLGIAGVSRKRA